MQRALAYSAPSVPFFDIELAWVFVSQLRQFEVQAQLDLNGIDPSSIRR